MLTCCQLYLQFYITKACQENPNQYIKVGTPKNKINSLVDKSTGNLYDNEDENPNSAFIQDLKKNVGPSRYRNISRNTVNIGKRSKKKEKNKNSDTKNIEPGKPRKISVFNSAHKNSFGHMKFIPLISVISLVLNLRAIASTKRKELVESSAWLIIIQKLASIKLD